MNLERAAMKGRLADLEHEKARLILKAEGLCKAIRTALNTALTTVEDLEIAQAAQQMDDLVMCMADLAAVIGQIQRLEKELG